MCPICVKFYFQFYILDLYDNSGIRLWITPTLRQYDTGIMQIGAAIGPDYQIVPPGQETWTTHGHCSSSCLAEVSWLSLPIPSLCVQYIHCQTMSDVLKTLLSASWPTVSTPWPPLSSSSASYQPLFGLFLSLLSASSLASFWPVLDLFLWLAERGHMILASSSASPWPSSCDWLRGVMWSQPLPWAPPFPLCLSANQDSPLTWV